MESLTRAMVNVFEFLFTAVLLTLVALFTLIMMSVMLYGFWDSFVRRRKRKHLEGEYHQYIHDFSDFAYQPDDDEYVVGLRYARLVYDKHQKLCFSSVGTHYHFGSQQRRAVCILGFEHKAPNFHCSCGFYSLRDFEKLRKHQHKYESGGSVVLEVRIGGKMIEGPHGVRSEYQTVERVWLPLACSRRFCKQRAVHMTMNMEHSQFERVRARLVQKCEDCLEEGDHMFPIQTLRNGLKTEVEWGLAPG